ncbi:FkbM family methyltransferase [Rhizobium sp. LjRoot98]|uniref:FkbM family methyltransferase n=1 Tax=unclassified Rhizobium TaxID=2613769 RepID=UPI00071636B5|nr:MULTISPECIES: FkbM family methyltransferase [unclassified Rhizobium]KQV30059.1 methyltransferase [Rhizobium sp. Root1204]KQY01167.1 methyltransferase [Rhizobium sp. Root1334]KRB96629.1 methyltransferase [Rhizobium sp. Root73]
MQVTKSWKRRLRKWRNRMAKRLLATRIGREMLVNAVSPKILSMTADCGDHLMTFSPHDYIGRKIYRKGHFQRENVVRLLSVLRQRALLQPEKVLLELGGNIGTQTVYFALSKAFRHIVTVEPDPRNFKLLRTNIDQNNLHEEITAINVAAGESEGTLDFFMHRDNHGKSSALRQSERDIQIKVPVKPVTAMLTEAGVAPDDIGLIWMDIEGYEPVASRSMQPLLARRVPFYMEFSPVFYGPAGSQAFVNYLAGFYENCIVFYEDSQVDMKVKALPIGKDQFDVLLLP